MPVRSGEGRGWGVGREGRSRQSLGVQRGRGGPGSGRGQWQYCTYVRVGGHRVITLDGVGLPTSQDHWPTNLGFGAIRDRGTFGRGLKQKTRHARVRIHRSGPITELRLRRDPSEGFLPSLLFSGWSWLNVDRGCLLHVFWMAKFECGRERKIYRMYLV